jgi:formylaminopyrimidine deformylase / aminopyrimidine aminohydrolase
MTILTADFPGETTAGIADALAESATDVQAAIFDHAWVKALADGTLPETALVNWAGQCRLFCLMERTALLTLRSRIQPGALDDLLERLVQDTVREPRELAELLTDLGAPIPEQPWRTCLGYGSYVQAMAHHDFLAGLTAVFAVERIYLETWSELLPSCPPDSPYRHWVENWTCEPFTRVVDGLGESLDRVAGPPSTALLQALTPVYRNVALWELDFWEMNWRGEGWPGLAVRS